ncbi:hypothetical protein HZB01_04930 [Candidatus Woesearchaeota archaeon]|nr:hypothetical protein [Candidatus Woesearchaeota archaeon]
MISRGQTPDLCTPVPHSFSPPTQNPSPLNKSSFHVSDAKNSYYTDAIDDDDTLSINDENTDSFSLPLSMVPNAFSYDTPSFTLTSGPCSNGQISFPAGETICLFSAEAEGMKQFQLADDVERVDIISQPQILFITHKGRLYDRYPNDAAGVGVILAKMFERAEKQKGVVYYLDREVETASPFPVLFADYHEVPLAPIYTNTANPYALAVGEFVRDRCNGCQDIVIVGDDYVVPEYRISYQREIGFDASGLLQPTLKTEHVFSDGFYAQRTFAREFNQLDEIFSRGEGFGGKPTAFILPDNFTPEQEAMYQTLRQTLYDRLNQPDFTEWRSSQIACNDFDLFNTLRGKTLVIVGNYENNNALHCYPFYGPDVLEDALFMDINVWDPDETTIFIDGSNEWTMKAFNQVVANGTWMEMRGAHWYALYNTLSGVSYVLLVGGLVASSGGTVATDGMLAFLIPYADSGSDALEVINDCAVLQRSDYCKISTASIFVAGLSAKYGKIGYKLFLRYAGDAGAVKLVKKYGGEFFVFIGKLFMKGADHVISFGKAIKNSGEYWDDVYQLFSKRVMGMADDVAKHAGSVDDLTPKLTTNARRVFDESVNAEAVVKASEAVSFANFEKRGGVLKYTEDAMGSGVGGKFDYVVEIGEENYPVQVKRWMPENPPTLEKARDRLGDAIDEMGTARINLPQDVYASENTLHYLIRTPNEKALMEEAFRTLKQEGQIQDNIKLVISEVPNYLMKKP